MENLRRCDIKLGKDENNDDVLTIVIRHSKTDQYNEGNFKTLKAVPGPVCPVKAMARLITLQEWGGDSEERVFGKWPRNRLSAILRLAGSAIGIPASRIGNHSLRSGGATAMWRAGYDIEVIKRRGRWKSASPQGYLWDDHRVLSTIGYGMLGTKGNTYQFAARGESDFDYWVTNEGRAGGHEPYGARNQRRFYNGRAGGKESSWECHRARDFLSENPRERIRAISKCMSKELRHQDQCHMQRDGFMPLDDLLKLESTTDLFASLDEVRRIVRGVGGNNKGRFEIGVMKDNHTPAIRDAQGHSQASGVADDILPLADGLVTLVHGATYKAARSIVKEGISKMDRLRVHLYESDLEGRLIRNDAKLRPSTEVIAVVSAERCERYGLIFHKSSNGVILTSGGEDGMIPADCILRIRQLPDYNVLWSSMANVWHAPRDEGQLSEPIMGKGMKKRRWKSRGDGNEPDEDLASTKKKREKLETVSSENPEKPTTTGGRVSPTGKRTGGRSNDQRIETTHGEVNPSESDDLFSPRDSNGEDDSQTNMVVRGSKRCTITMNTANRNYDMVTTEEVITRTVLGSTVSGSESESEKEENTTSVYPATPTSSSHSDTRVAKYSTVRDSKTQWPQQGEWRLGQPYFRDSRQHQVEAYVQVETRPMQPPPGITMDYGHMQQMGMYNNGVVNGLEAASSSFDPRWMSPRPESGQGGPYVGCNQMWSTPSSSRTSSGKGGKSTPETSPQQRRENKRILELCQTCGHNTKSKSLSSAGGNWAPYLPKPTAKSDAQKLRQEQAHGERVQCGGR